MSNPQISQGTINRLRASVVIPSLPQLNVTAAFLGEEAIRMAFEGDATLFINTLTGAVTSPEPYLMVNVTVNLLKTQAIANAWKAQMETSAILGDLTIRPDTPMLNPYALTNCSIMRPGDLDFSGKSAAYPVSIRGYYIINNALWNS